MHVFEQAFDKLIFYLIAKGSCFVAQVDLPLSQFPKCWDWESVTTDSNRRSYLLCFDKSLFFYLMKYKV